MLALDESSFRPIDQCIADGTHHRFQQGVVPDSKVIVINTGTRVHYDSVTNETGSYYVTNLPPGTYRIEVEKLGFKAVIKSGIAPGQGRGEQ